MGSAARPRGVGARRRRLVFRRLSLAICRLRSPEFTRGGM